MIIKTSLGEYKVGGIYRHFKGNLYKIESISKLHDSQNIFIINYHQCDINGIYLSIRKEIAPIKDQEDIREEIIFQPFATHETRWNDMVTTYDMGEPRQVQRFTLLK